MPHIPAAVAESDLSRLLETSGLKRIHRGKVRDTHDIDGKRWLVNATRRLSIFDFVLPTLVKKKDEILTALTIFWLYGPLKEFTHHCLAYGEGIDQYLPPHLHRNPQLQKSGLIIRRLDMFPVEWVVREYLTGGGYTKYKEQGHICGVHLRPGLHDGSRLDEPILTPTTKSPDGHDEDLLREAVRKQYGYDKEELCLRKFKIMADHAATRGIILADHKSELGMIGKKVVIGDEIGTGDCGRWWRRKDWEISSQKQQAPQGMDKEIVRKWGKEITYQGTPFNKLDPKNPEHLRFVDQLEVPETIIDQTTALYQELFESLTGQSLETFQSKFMHITA